MTHAIVLIKADRTALATLGGELGAFHDLRDDLRHARGLAAIQEFAPVGIATGILFES